MVLAAVAPVRALAAPQAWTSDRVRDALFAQRGTNSRVEEVVSLRDGQAGVAQKRTAAAPTTAHSQTHDYFFSYYEDERRDKDADSDTQELDHDLVFSLLGAE